MGELKRLTENEILESLPGDTWNRFVDATGYVERSRALTPNGSGFSTSGAKALTIIGKNATGADLPVLGIVGIGDCLLSPANDASASHYAPRMEFAEVANEHAQRFAIVQVPAKTNQEQVPAIFRGITWANVDIVTAGDKTCGIVAADEGKLTSGKSGAAILWAANDPSTGEQLCVVDINGASANPGALATGIVVTADVPKATYNQTTGELTPGTSVSARVKPLAGDPPGGVPTKLIEEQSGGSDLELEVLNYTQSTIYHDAHPSRQVFGFRQTFGGVEYFVIIGNLRRSAINGDAAAAVSTFAGTFSVNNIEVISGSGPTETNGTASTSVTVDNTFGFAIDSGGRVRCEQKDDGTWECVQAECPV